MSDTTPVPPAPRPAGTADNTPQQPHREPQTPFEARSSSALTLFLGRFMRHPSAVGAIAPSSRFLARKMVRGVPLESGVRIVEFGPGTGPFTREILAHLPAKGAYLGIERDAAFFDVLVRRFPDGSFHHGSVEHLPKLLAEKSWPAVDHIVSGLPFASLPTAVTRNILDATSAALAEGGTFTTFQYIHAYWLPSARVFRRVMNERCERLPGAGVELRNLPPAFVFRWRKRSSSV